MELGPGLERAAVKMVTLQAMKAGLLEVLAAQGLLEDWALDLTTKMIHENHLFHAPGVTSNLLRPTSCCLKQTVSKQINKWTSPCACCLPAMTVCLKSSSLKWGRKQTIRSQVISHKSENPVLESALWKIPAVSITSSMFLSDSGIASSCTYKHRTDGQGQILANNFTFVPVLMIFTRRKSSFICSLVLYLFADWHQIFSIL